MMDSKRSECDQQSLQHAWDWFSLHAAQRMQTFNYFLVATALMVSAYGSLIEKHSEAALAVAVAGAWIGYWFARLDRRARQLVNAGEAALEAAQARLAEDTADDNLNILRNVRVASKGSSSYGKVIMIMEWTVVIGFFFGFLYALCSLLHLLSPGGQGADFTIHFNTQGAGS